MKATSRQILLKALKAYQRELWKQIEFHNSVGNKELASVLTPEVFASEDLEAEIKKAKETIALSALPKAITRKTRPASLKRKYAKRKTPPS